GGRSHRPPPILTANHNHGVRLALTPPLGMRPKEFFPNQRKWPTLRRLFVFRQHFAHSSVLLSVKAV
ncbi:MAG: hypothetical protein KDE50_08910, partial [Caldilineaceae bacterium]|nr:hypothetical protein [Caldilineaceae bacterium]